MKRGIEYKVPLRLRINRTIYGMFDPGEYTRNLARARDFIKERLPEGFTPLIALVPGSRGLDQIINTIEPVTDPIDYEDIPGFPRTKYAQHKGQLHAGYMNGIPIVVMRRRHLYEEGDSPNLVTTLKNITFPVYLSYLLDAKIYFATNAAGGLNELYKEGDLMVIKSHLSSFFPDAAFGPPLPFENGVHFPRQHNLYSDDLRELLISAAQNVQEEKTVHSGVYAAISGRHFEAPPDANLLRLLKVDAVGMSTVPEIQVAGRLGMDTVGVAFISDIIDPDGVTITTLEQIREMKHDITVLNRICKIICEAIRLIGENRIAKNSGIQHS